MVRLNKINEKTKVDNNKGLENGSGLVSVGWSVETAVTPLTLLSFVCKQTNF